MSGPAALLVQIALAPAARLGDSAKPPPDNNALVILVVFLVIAVIIAGVAVLLSKVGRR
jgi:hypothetical protein